MDLSSLEDIIHELRDNESGAGRIVLCCTTSKPLTLDEFQAFISRVSELCNVLQMNSTAKEIIICNDFMRYLSNYMKDALFEAIGTLQNMQNLSISDRNRFLGRTVTRRPIPFLVRQLMKAINTKNIIALDVEGRNLVGNDHDYQRFTKTIQECVSLKKFRLSLNYFPQEMNFQYFIESLAQLPKLTRLSIEESSQCDFRNNHNLNIQKIIGNKQVIAITRMVQTQIQFVCLRKLVLRGLDLSPASFSDLAVPRMLEENKKLRYLGLPNTQIGNTACIEIAKALQHNNSTLRILDLRHCGLEESGYVEFANTIRKNKALKTLYLNNGQSLTITSIKALSDAIEENCCLKKFTYDVNNTQQQDEGLSHPQPFDIVDINNQYEKYSKKISFHLKLNAWGRNQCLAGCNGDFNIHEQKMMLLRCHSEQCLSAMFYCIRRNPLFIFMIYEQNENNNSQYQPKTKRQRKN